MAGVEWVRIDSAVVVLFVGDRGGDIPEDTLEWMLLDGG